jgi:hypothetical protein
MQITSITTWTCLAEDNIKLNLKEMKCVNTHWIQLPTDTAQKHVPVNTPMKLVDSIKYGKLLDKLGDCLILKASFTPHSLINL